MKLAFLAAEPFLQAPVKNPAGHDSRRGFENQIAADRPDARVREVLQEPYQGIGGPALTGVSENQHVALARLISSRERRRFAFATRPLQNTHEAPGRVTAG